MPRRKPPGTWLAQLEHPAGASFLTCFPKIVYPPNQWPKWLSEQDLKYYVSQFTPGTGAARGMFGPVSWYRNVLDFAEVGKEVGPSKKFEMPVMFLYGAESDVVRYSSDAWQKEHGTWEEMMRPWFTDLRVFEAVPKCGHWVPFENPEFVNPRVLSFLNSVKNLP